jgi:hypothetical protein
MNGKGQLIGWAVVLGMWTSCGIGLNCIKNSEIREASNTAEDMIEWIGYDMENGKIDSTTAQDYIMNLEEVVSDLGVVEIKE